MKFHQPPFLLRELKIEVTYRCSLQCLHCSSDAHPTNPLAMTEAQGNRIIEESSRLGVTRVDFSGGEPLLWSPLLSVVRTATRKGMRVGVYTTGNVPDASNRLRGLRDAGVTSCVFSLFGACPTTHERITRSAGTFNGTLAAIRESGRLQLKPEIHFVPFRDNYRDLRAVAELATTIGVGRVSVLRFVPQGRGSLYRKHILNHEQNMEMKSTIEQLRRESRVEVRTGSPYNFLLLNTKDAACRSGIDRLIVGPDLRIYPCDAFKQIRAEEVAGSADHSSLLGCSMMECWDKSSYLNAVRTYLTTDFGSPCRACGNLANCLSGCLAQKVLVNGTLEKAPDPDCIRRKGHRP